MTPPFASALNLPAPLAALHERLHGHLCTLVGRLPSTPPSFVAAQILDQLLLPRLPADARAALQGHTVALTVTDLGLRVRLRIGPNGFEAAGDGTPAALTILATAEGFLCLARGQEDPDRLFFERRLMMEGDTELGLVLKNTLDAIGPLWPPPALNTSCTAGTCRSS